ncbi:Uncharacterised protein [Neisseria animaloris]|nr:hypothetical protein [Neisseria animaloris]VEH87812.1 Uncharacterised protein [Neisseria animaloris]
MKKTSAVVLSLMLLMTTAVAEARGFKCTQWSHSGPFAVCKHWIFVW